MAGKGPVAEGHREVMGTVTWRGADLGIEEDKAMRRERECGRATTERGW